MDVDPDHPKHSRALRQLGMPTNRWSELCRIAGGRCTPLSNPASMRCPKPNAACMVRSLPFPTALHRGESYRSPGLEFTEISLVLHRVVSSSLVVFDPTHARYRMLKVVRDHCLAAFRGGKGRIPVGARSICGLSLARPVRRRHPFDDYADRCYFPSAKTFGSSLSGGRPAT